MQLQFRVLSSLKTYATLTFLLPTAFILSNKYQHIHNWNRYIEIFHSTWWPMQQEKINYTRCRLLTSSEFRYTSVLHSSFWFCIFTKHRYLSKVFCVLIFLFSLECMMNSTLDYHLFFCYRNSFHGPNFVLIVFKKESISTF